MKAGRIATIFSIIYIFILYISGKIAYDITIGLFDNDANLEEVLGDIIGFIFGLIFWMGFQFFALVFLFLGKLSSQRQIILFPALIGVLANLIILPGVLMYLSITNGEFINVGALILAIPLIIQLFVIRKGFNNK